MSDIRADSAAAMEALARGQLHLQAGERALAAAALRQALNDTTTRLTAHNLIERHALEGAFVEWMGFNCEIAPADDICRFFENHPTSVNPLRDYLADGWRTLSELMLLLEAADRPLLKTSSVLEFASGHGRFTRHLVKALGAQRVTVSDVVPDAVDFARRAFGVTGVLSTTQPEDLHWPRRYELVFVLSLFSHLPRSSWSRWLMRLFDAVEPGGLLVISTHGEEAARRQNVALDETGFFFAASSESAAIDVQEYGTAFTSEAFVRERIAETLGSDCLMGFEPSWFWRHQDAFVLCRPA